MIKRSFFGGIILLLCFSPLFPNSDWKQQVTRKIEKEAIPNWAKEQIERDFSQIDPTSFSTKNRNDLHHKNLWLSDPDLVDVTISKNKIFIEPYGRAIFSDRLETMRNVFQTLISIIDLPDVSLTFSLHDDLDWYVLSRGQALPFPVLVFAKHRKSRDQILIPDWEIFRGYEDFYREVLDATRDFPWGEKNEIAIWRGTTTGAEYTVANYKEQWRTKLVKKSLDFPDVIDARFHFVCQNDPELIEELKVYIGDHVSIYEQLRCKYQILIDGNTAAFSRAYWQLFSNSVIFKQDSPYIQWYTNALIPYVHYFPLARNLHDLEKKIALAKMYDQTAEQIASNATDFAEKNLRQEDIYTYLYFVISEFAKRQTRL